jgi:23S rRNA (guanosine2251-2'-O)-methyltransferase
MAALANEARHCRRLLTTSEALRSHPELEARLAARQVGAETVDRSAIDAILPAGAVHQGIALAVEPLDESNIDDLAGAAEGRDPAVIVVLDQVTDPHNLGAVMRSAAAFGALGVVVTERHAPSETGTLAKSASGALERVPLVRAINLARALDELKAAGFWIVGLAGDAPTTLAAAKLSGRVALVLGAEGEGMRRLTRERCDLLVKLPQTDAVESLNVSNAAAVALYEMFRR